MLICSFLVRVDRVEVAVHHSIIQGTLSLHGLRKLGDGPGRAGNPQTGPGLCQGPPAAH